MSSLEELTDEQWTIIEPLILSPPHRADGSSTVPDAPGCGLSIDEKAFASEVSIRLAL